MRIAALLCLIAATALAGCSSSRGRTVRTQPPASVASGSSYTPARTVRSQPVERVVTTHERVLTSADVPAAPALPESEATFVPASRPAPAKVYNDVAVSAPDPCDPCARPARNCCPPRIQNPFCRPKCCPPGG